MGKIVGMTHQPVGNEVVEVPTRKISKFFVRQKDKFYNLITPPLPPSPSPPLPPTTVTTTTIPTTTTTNQNGYEGGGDSTSG